MDLVVWNREIWFDISTKQDDPASPSQFTAYLERMMDGIRNNGTGVTIEGERISKLTFADDINLIEDSWEALQETVSLL